MNMQALKAVLEALAGKCQDDMADKFSSPEEKMEDAMVDVKGEEDEEETSEPLAEPGAEAGLEEVEEKDPVKAALKLFMKPKPPGATKPGTAIMIALDKKKTMKKGGMNV